MQLLTQTEDNLMRRTRIITIELETTTKTDFGITFMQEIIEKVVIVANNFRKSYSAKIKSIKVIK